MCAGEHATGTRVLTATVANLGPAVMPNRTAIVALAAAALMMIGTIASASTREVVRYTAEVQPGTIVVKTAERRLYLVLGQGEAIRYSQIWPTSRSARLRVVPSTLPCRLHAGARRGGRRSRQALRLRRHPPRPEPARPVGLRGPALAAGRQGQDADPDPLGPRRHGGFCCKVSFSSLRASGSPWTLYPLLDSTFKTELCNRTLHGGAVGGT